MPLPNMTPQQLLSAAQVVIDHTEHMGPECELAKNQVGNLAVMDHDGFQVGWIDLRFGEVTCYECPDPEGVYLVISG